MINVYQEKELTPDQLDNYEAGRDLVVKGLDDNQMDRLAFLMDLARCYESLSSGRPVEDIDFLESLRDDYDRFSDDVVDLEISKMMKEVNRAYGRALMAEQAAQKVLGDLAQSPLIRPKGLN